MLNPLEAPHDSQAGTLVLNGRAQNPFCGKQNDPKARAFVVADAPITRTPPTRSAKLPAAVHPGRVSVAGAGGGAGGAGGGGGEGSE